MAKAATRKATTTRKARAKPTVETVKLPSNPTSEKIGDLFRDRNSSTLNNNPPDPTGDPNDFENKDLVVYSLRQILLDTGASAAAKASAARTLAEIEGVLGRHAAPPKDSTKPLAAMTREELEAELARESAGI